MAWKKLINPKPVNLTGLLGLLGNNFIRPRSQKIEITLAVSKLSWYCDCHCFYQKLRKVRSFLICCFSLWTIFYLKIVNFSMKRNQLYRNVSWNGWLDAVEPCWLRANCCFFLPGWTASTGEKKKINWKTFYCGQLVKRK